MKKLHTLATAVALSGFSLGVHAQAALNNGDFSAGLAGWQVIGDASIQGGTALELWLTTASVDFEDDFPLAAGALNRSGQGAVSGGLEAFVGLSAGGLDPDPQGGLQAYEGSAALQSFSAGVGDTLSFRWDFGTSDGFADYAFAVVDGQIFRLAGPADAGQPGRLGNLYQTGEQTFSLSFTRGGEHTLAFGVVDVGDYNVTSTLAIAGVQVSAVPEPGALALMLAGLAATALGARGRRRQ